MHGRPIPSPASDAKETTPRGDRTRDRLLDAAEALVARDGYEAPSYRSVASRAGVHVALIHYHFGSKDALYDAALARRAPRLAQAWRESLDLACADGAPDPARVLRAWWRPFGAALAGGGPVGIDYAGMVARLPRRPGGPAARAALFGAVEARFRHALRARSPGTAPRDLAVGWACASRLMDDLLLARSGHDGGFAGTLDGDDAPERLLDWLAARTRARVPSPRAAPADVD